MARTDEAAVRAIIDTDANIDVAPFIATATVLADKVAAADTAGSMTASALERMECYLAAYFYAIRDGQYTQKTTGSASGSYQRGAPGKGLEINDWGQAAIMLDDTGVLVDLLKTKTKRRVLWLGKNQPAERDWWVRNT